MYNLPNIGHLWVESCHGLSAAIVTGDDLLEGVEKEVLSLWIGLDL